MNTDRTDGLIQDVQYGPAPQVRQGGGPLMDQRLQTVEHLIPGDPNGFTVLRFGCSGLANIWTPAAPATQCQDTLTFGSGDALLIQDLGDAPEPALFRLSRSSGPAFFGPALNVRYPTLSFPQIHDRQEVGDRPVRRIDLDDA